MAGGWLTSAPPPSTDEELYAGVYIDFMGTDAAIFRTMGKQTAMRTDQYNSRWLNGWWGVASAQVPQGPHGSSLREEMERVTLRPPPRAETVASAGRCTRGGAGRAMDAWGADGEVMGGWMVGEWMDGRVGGWMSEWVGGWMDE